MSEITPAPDLGLTDLIAAHWRSLDLLKMKYICSCGDWEFRDDDRERACASWCEHLALVVEQHTNGRIAEENEILRNDVFESENERKGWSTRALTAEATVDRVQEFADNAQGWFDSHQQGPVADAVEVLIDYLRAALEGEQQ